jgi:hypothetical protein
MPAGHLSFPIYPGGHGPAEIPFLLIRHFAKETAVLMEIKKCDASLEH